MPEDFDRVLHTVPSIEPTTVHSDLVSQDGVLLAPESNTESPKVFLLLKLIPGQALDQEQQQHTKDLYLDHWLMYSPTSARNSPLQKLRQSLMTEASPESGLLITAGCRISTVHTNCNRRLGQSTFMDFLKRKHFYELMVEILERANKQVQHLRYRNIQSEERPTTKAREKAQTGCKA